MAKRRGKSGELRGVTSKDFIAVARAMCKHSANVGLIEDIADYFGGQNPRFDRGRFIAAAACKTK